MQLPENGILTTGRTGRLMLITVDHGAVQGVCT